MTTKWPDRPDLTVRTSGLEGFWETATQAAQRLGISGRTLRRLAKRGKVQRRGQGADTRYRVPAALLEEYQNKISGQCPVIGRTPDEMAVAMSGHADEEALGIPAVVVELAQTNKRLGAAEVELAQAHDALCEAQIAFTRLQADLVDARAEIAALRLTIAQHRRS